MDKIVFLISVMNMGGAERIMSALANYASKSGREVTVILTQQALEDANLSRLEKGIRVISLKDEIEESKKHTFAAQILMLAARLIGKLGSKRNERMRDRASVLKYQSRNYDRIQWLKGWFSENPQAKAVAFLYDSIFLALLAAKKSNRLVISERGDPEQSSESRTDFAFFRHMFPKADAMVFQSPDVRDWHKENIGLDGTVIYNPIKEGLPESWTGERKKRIVNFCRITAQKNLFLLLKSYEKFAAEFPDFELYIYGELYQSEKAYGEAFLEAVGKSPFKESIHVFPAIHNIHEEILDYAMFVSSSDFEGMSNSMLEAMAIGLPTVCTDCPAGGARAIIRDHENGLLTPVGDEEALYKAMKELIEDPALAEKLSENGIKLREELTAEKIMKKWMELRILYQKRIIKSVH